MSDREFIIQSLIVDGLTKAFEQADDNLKKDRAFVLVAVKFSGMLLEYAADSLKADREIVLEAVKRNGRALEHADDSLKADREIVLEAVKRNGRALEHADDSLKADCEIVLAAVKQDGDALEQADDSLKKDRAFVLEAIKNDDYALAHADDSLKADRKFMLEAVKINSSCFYYANENLREDWSFVLPAIIYCGESICKYFKNIDPEFNFFVGLLLQQYTQHSWPSGLASEFVQSRYSSAAELGHTEAQYKLGMQYEELAEQGSNLEFIIKAMAWFRAAAKQGHAGAQYKLGMLLGQYAGIAALAFGEDESETFVGFFNEPDKWLRGKDESEILNEADEWLHKAAEKGIVQARYEFRLKRERHKKTFWYYSSIFVDIFSGEKEFFRQFSQRNADADKNNEKRAIKKIKKIKLLKKNQLNRKELAALKKFSNEWWERNRWQEKNKIWERLHPPKENLVRIEAALTIIFGAVLFGLSIFLLGAGIFSLIHIHFSNKDIPWEVYGIFIPITLVLIIGSLFISRHIYKKTKT